MVELPYPGGNKYVYVNGSLELLRRLEANTQGLVNTGHDQGMDKRCEYALVVPLSKATICKGELPKTAMGFRYDSWTAA